MQSRNTELSNNKWRGIGLNGFEMRHGKYILIAELCNILWTKNKTFCFSPITIPQNTMPPSPMKPGLENVEISINPSDVVMRGTVVVNTAKDKTCASPSPQDPSAQSLRERFVSLFMKMVY